MSYVQLCLQQGGYKAADDTHVHGHCGFPLGHEGRHSWEPSSDDDEPSAFVPESKPPALHLAIDCPIHGPLIECASCVSDSDDAGRFHDAAVLHSIATAATSLLTFGSTFTPAELAEHAFQIAGELAARRKLEGLAAHESNGDPKRLDTELALLRTIAHGALSQVNLDGEPGACAGDAGTRLQLAGFLREWVTDYEGPRVGVTRGSIPPGTELVDVATSLRGKWRPHP